MPDLLSYAHLYQFPRCGPQLRELENAIKCTGRAAEKVALKQWPGRKESNLGVGGEGGGRGGGNEGWTQEGRTEQSGYWVEGVRMRDQRRLASTRWSPRPGLTPKTCTLAP